MLSAPRLKPASSPPLAKNGAEVVGGVKHPLGTSDFSSYVLQAQQSGADVIALNNGGDDTVNALKAIREFGLKAKVMGFGLDSPIAIKSMGLATAQGAYNVNPWVNAGDAETKAFIDKFIQRRKVFPGSFQVGNYSAAQELSEGRRSDQFDRPEDGDRQDPRRPRSGTCSRRTAICARTAAWFTASRLTQIKAPNESTGEWDLTKVVAKLAGDDVFRPLADGGVPALAAK